MKSYRSLADLQSDLFNGKISCEEVINHHLNLIEQNDELNAFLEVFKEESISSAREVDLKIANNKNGKLAGLSVSIKDLLSYKDHKAQASSNILKDYTAPYSATAIERLIKEDAIILGRTNNDEFGMGSTGENSFAGPTKNPIDKLYRI